MGTCQRFFAFSFSRPPGRLTVALSLLLLLGLLGCGANRRSFFGGDVTVCLHADSEINENSPVQVEMIVVYDEDLLKALLAKTAHEWFQEREQIAKDHPKKGFTSMRWEIVPGQILPAENEPDLEVSFGTGARAVIVFADYFSEGAHRQRFDTHTDLVIHLQDKDFSLEQPQ